MENISYNANENYVAKKGNKFQGLKNLTIENDVITITMGTGLVFSAPINEVQVEYTTGWRLLLQSPLMHKYKFTSSAGQTLTIDMYKGWEGFGKEKLEVYETIESLPNVKKSALEKFELWIGWIIVAVCLITYFAI